MARAAWHTWGRMDNGESLSEILICSDDSVTSDAMAMIRLRGDAGSDQSWPPQNQRLEQTYQSRPVWLPPPFMPSSVPTCGCVNHLFSQKRRSGGVRLNRLVRLIQQLLPLRTTFEASCSFFRSSSLPEINADLETAIKVHVKTLAATAVSAIKAKCKIQSFHERHHPIIPVVRRLWRFSDEDWVIHSKKQDIDEPVLNWSGFQRYEIIANPCYANLRVIHYKKTTKTQAEPILQSRQTHWRTESALRSATSPGNLLKQPGYRNTNIAAVSFSSHGFHFKGLSNSRHSAPFSYSHSSEPGSIMAG